MYLSAVVSIGSQRARSPKTLAPATEVRYVGIQALRKLSRATQINTVVKFLKINEKNASTGTHNVCCLHHDTGVDGGS